MRLRGRFALWFSVAALVPILLAALVTREFLSRSYREDFEARKAAAQTEIDRELTRLRRSVDETIGAVASVRDDVVDEFVAGLLVTLEKGDGQLSGRERRRFAQKGAVKMIGLGLDLFVVANADDTVLVAPHNRALVDERAPIYSQRARALEGRATFVLEKVMSSSEGGGVESSSLVDALVLEAARITRQGGQRVTVSGGKIIETALVAPQPGRDARIVSADGALLVAPAGDWAVVQASVITTPLVGADGQPVAFVEVGLSDSELREVLRSVTLYSALIALAAVVLCIGLGLWLGRRMTRDLDQLMIGVEAAARGDLDHQVPVRTRDEIGALSSSMNQMMLDLKESKERLSMAERVAAWQEIARRLAHEIKNPLTPIQMSVETLRKTWAKKHPSFDEIFEESTATVLEEAARLKRIVSEFSEFARMPKPNKRRLDLNELVSQGTALYRGSVPLELNLGTVPEIEADRDSLSQVLLNLLENARDAIKSVEDGEGKIRVQTLPTRNGKAVALVVDDNGTGLPPEVKGKLFTPYFTTKHATGGSGLGLAIVHRIVTDHGGNILATDSPLGGARFVVELPTGAAGPGDLSASLTGQLERSS